MSNAPRGHVCTQTHCVPRIIRRREPFPLSRILKKKHSWFSFDHDALTLLEYAHYNRDERCGSRMSIGSITFSRRESWVFIIFHYSSINAWINAWIRRRLTAKVARMRGVSVASSLSPVRRRFAGGRTFSGFFALFSSSKVTRECERTTRVSYRHRVYALFRTIVVIWSSGRCNGASVATGNKCALSSSCDARVARKWPFLTYSWRQKLSLGRVLLSLKLNRECERTSGASNYIRRLSLVPNQHRVNLLV